MHVTNQAIVFDCIVVAIGHGVGNDGDDQSNRYGHQLIAQGKIQKMINDFNNSYELGNAKIDKSSVSDR